MGSHIKLGRVFGIEVGIHFSWFIIAWLITSSLIARFHSVNPDWSTAVVWTAAGITAVLFFLSLLAHELAHRALPQQYPGSTAVAPGTEGQLETRALIPLARISHSFFGNQRASSEIQREIDNSLLLIEEPPCVLNFGRVFWQDELVALEELMNARHIENAPRVQS